MTRLEKSTPSTQSVLNPYANITTQPLKISTLPQIGGLTTGTTLQ
jgi:hypothetical protein